jgi:hypothetical protein
VRRFVVLHHTGVAAPHYDLLFEWEPGEPLTSFRCPTWPPTPGEAWEERPDHRRAYLDYEGPISGDRGVVARRAAGTLRFDVMTVDPPSLVFTFDGSLCVVVAHEIGRGRWVVQSVGA